MDMNTLNWLLDNSKGIDAFFLIVGVIIEVIIMVAIWIVYKHYKKKSNSDE